MKIDVDSELGLMLAITGLIQKSSDMLIPKECDRLQLTYNVEALYSDLKLRKHWLEISLGIRKPIEELKGVEDVKKT